MFVSENYETHPITLYFTKFHVLREMLARVYSKCLVMGVWFGVCYVQMCEIFVKSYLRSLEFLFFSACIIIELNFSRSILKKI